MRFELNKHWMMVAVAALLLRQDQIEPAVTIEVRPCNIEAVVRLRGHPYRRVTKATQSVTTEDPGVVRLILVRLADRHTQVQKTITIHIAQ